jgi:hypothetical protein
MLRLLKELADMAEEASLTGSLAEGAPQAVQRYNAVLHYLEDEDAVPEDLFEKLPESTSFAKLGVECRLLAAYFEPGEESTKGDKGKGNASILVRLAPFVDSNDLAELVKEHVKNGTSIDVHMLTALAPFLKSSDLGQLMRQHVSGWFKQSEAEPKPAGAPAPSPAPPTPAAEPTRDLVPAPEHAPARPTLDELAIQLRRENLSQEERQAIAIQLAEIAHEQARYEG